MPWSTPRPPLHLIDQPIDQIDQEHQMTEQNLNSEPVPGNFEDEFDGWLAGAAIAKRSVPIYGKPGLYADYQEIARRREIAAAVVDDEESLGNEETDQLDEQLAAIYDEWMASKSTWVVRALNEDETKEVKSVRPERDEVPDLPARATEDQRREHAAKVAELRDLRAKDADEENLLALSKAVVTVTFSNGRVQEGVTVEQLRKLSTALGARQIALLMTEAMRANIEEPEIPAPFSQRTSSNARTS